MTHGDAAADMRRPPSRIGRAGREGGWIALAMLAAACVSHPAANGVSLQAAPVAADSVNPRAVQPERPTVATHAGTVAPGFLEIETGLQRDQLGALGQGLSVPTVLKFGAAPRTQLSVFLPLSRSTETRLGAGDVAIGVKWRIIEDNPILSDFAVLPIVKFSTGGDRGTGTTDGTLLLIDSHTFGAISMDLNVAWTWRSGDGTRVPTSSSLWTASFGLPVAGPMGWVAELYGFPGTGGPAGMAPTVAFLTGPTFKIREELALDAGFITPVSGPQSHSLYAGLVVNTGRFVR